MNNDTVKPNSEEVDVVALGGYVWRTKYWIAAASAVSILIGLAYSMLAAPVYRAEALIAPKELQKGMGMSGALSQLTGMGGFMASQLGLGSNSLARMEIMVRSREVADTVIRKSDLLPVLFPKEWDKGGKKWKHPETAPDMSDGIERIRTKVLKVSINEKKNYLLLGVETSDSAAAAGIVSTYISALNNQIRENVQKESELNRQFLDSQMMLTSDPQLREKLLTMNSMELEKAMMVYSQSIDVLEKPINPKRKEWPRPFLIMGLAAFLGAFLATISAFIVYSVQETLRRRESPKAKA